MKKTEFDPNRKIGESILSYDRQQLCIFAIKLCERVKADAGAGAYRGGIFPDNISADEDGELAIGAARRDSWSGQELDFLPPELYWNGRPGPASDVYSIGLLLYYAVSGGALPFDGECRDAQLRRMGGDEFKIPKAAGRRLGDIIKKATRFKSAERYQSMDELRANIESCLKNLYLNGAPSAETIFNKSDDDLSDIERMMVGIIERDEDQSAAAEEEPAPPEDSEHGNENSEIANEEPAAAEESADETLSAAEGADNAQDDFSLAAECAREAENERSGSGRVPRLYVEKNPELEPVVINKNANVTPVVKYTRDLEKERRMEEEVKKRKRRPVAVILVLCAVLVIAAIVFNAIIKDLNDSMTNDPTGSQADSVAASAEPVTASDSAAETETPEASVVPTESVSEEDLLPIEPDPAGTPYIPGASGSADSDDADAPEAVASEAAATSGEGEHRYELYIEDVSWTEAKEKCEELGGHLAVPNDAAEFVSLVELAESRNITMIWIGGHRENGTIVWEDGSTAPYEQWAKGEPSYVDSGDGAAEDYVLLWQNGGWYFNDSRNDPCGEFPDWYGGKMAYICEYEG